MSNGCSEKDADLSCLDRPKFKLLRNHKFLRERDINVKEFFSLVETTINIREDMDLKSELKIYSDSDPELLRMNGEVHFDCNKKESIIKITELMAFVSVIAFSMDI
jgi:hypothetical protein